MKITAISSIHRIDMDEKESLRFKKRFPNSKEIEAFVETIEEEGSHLYINDDEEVIIEVEVDFSSFPFYGDVKREVERVKGCIQDQINREL